MKNKILVVICLLLFTTTISVYAADIFPGGFPQAYVNPLKYNYNMDSSYGNSIVSPAASRWNGNSSKVSLTRSTTNAKVDVFSVTGTIPDRWGFTMLYYKDPSTGSLVRDYGGYEIWDYGIIYGYENMMVASNFTQGEKIENYCHEFGHTLSLAHVTSGSAVMALGRQDLWVTSIDRANLRAKWGN